MSSASWAIPSISSETFTLGRNARDQPWQIGISVPVSNWRIGGQVAAAFSLSGRALSTSGDYQKFFFDAQGHPHPAELSCAAGACQAFTRYRAGGALIRTSAERRAGSQRRDEPGPETSMSKKLSVPQTGRTGAIVNVITRYGQVERQFVTPRNPQAPDQQAIRNNFGRVSARWRFLTPEQRAAGVVLRRQLHHRPVGPPGGPQRLQLLCPN